MRRSLFNNAERTTFLAQLVKGVKSILEQPQVRTCCVLSSTLSLIVFVSVQTLADPECYHEFCRLLMRLKSNYQLGELIRLDSYPSFLELVVKFTVSSLQVKCTSVLT